MAYPRAKLTPFGRTLLVQRVLILHWPVNQVAASLGISRPTAYKWLRRWSTEGPTGLIDRSSRPHRSPRRTPAWLEDRILRLRRQLRFGPRRLAPRVGRYHTTVYSVLRRHQLSRLRDSDRASGVPIRYVRERPGELLHLDMKPLGRIPPGGGHRFLGRARARRRGGTEVLHVAVDDVSRLLTTDPH